MAPGCSHSSPAAHDVTLTVMPFIIKEYAVYLNQGDTIWGFFTVSGGDKYILFSIYDSWGDEVTDTERATERLDFSYTAMSKGEHALRFFNPPVVSVPLTEAKQVYLHYRIK